MCRAKPTMNLSYLQVFCVYPKPDRSYSFVPKTTKIHESCEPHHCTGWRVPSLRTSFGAIVCLESALKTNNNDHLLSLRRVVLCNAEATVHALENSSECIELIFFHVFSTCMKLTWENEVFCTWLWKCSDHRIIYTTEFPLFTFWILCSAVNGWMQ